MSFAWTDDRIDTLKKLWGEGHSCSQIAARMSGGLTRNAIIGKVRRLGLSYRSGPMADPFTDVNLERKLARKFGTPPRPCRRAPGDQPPTQPLPALTPPSEMKRVPFLETKGRQCRFPLWGPDQKTGDCCGNRAPIGEPYCEFHARITSTRPMPRKKWADDDPRRAAFAARARQTFNVREDA